MINKGMATTFKGFSTVDNIRAPYSLYDVELAKRDLLNEFYTRKGERLMRPNFGSIIWDLLMEPEDESTEQLIKEDIEKIVSKDPRVELKDTVLFISDHTIRAEVFLNYVQTNTDDILYLEFVNNNSGSE
jgi:phage baseplate assembly protein W